MSLPYVSVRERQKANRLYPLWVRNRNGGPWDIPEGTELHETESVLGNIRFNVLPGGDSVVVLAHPDRRYGGHWFVKTGWVEALAKDHTVIWFDFPGYGQGNGGSPYLAENVIAVADAAQAWGNVKVVGVSLGSFATAIAAPHMPWVKRIVLESPYPSFMSWYEGKGLSTGKMVMRVFGVFLKSARKLDAAQCVADAPMPILGTASKVDEVTDVSLSLDTFRDNCETIILEDAAHLELFDDAVYREKVLAFLRD